MSNLGLAHASWRDEVEINEIDKCANACTDIGFGYAEDGEGEEPELEGTLETTLRHAKLRHIRYKTHSRRAPRTYNQPRTLGGRLSGRNTAEGMRNAQDVTLAAR